MPDQSVEINRSQRIAKNTLLLYFRQFLILLVALYSSRTLLDEMGPTDYGIYNVVASFIIMLGFINGAMISGTQRFMAYAIGENNFENLRKTFSSSLLLHFLMGIIVFIIAETIGLWFVSEHLVIPESRYSSAVLAYHFSALTFIISASQVPYYSLLVAHEQMSVYAKFSILEVLIKLASVLFIKFIHFQDNLRVYSLLLFGGSLLYAFVFRLYVIRQFREAKFVLVKDCSLYKRQFSFFSWNLLGNLSFVAKNQGLNIVVNMFFGPAVNAAQALANQVSSAVSSFYTNFQLASSPQIIKSYALKDYHGMLKIAFQACKFSFFLMLIISTPIILEAEALLKIWLKDVPEYSIEFTKLVLVASLIESISGPLLTLVQAKGTIRKFQTVVSIIWILTIPIIYLLFNIGFNPIFSYIVTIFFGIIVFISKIIIVQQEFPTFSMKFFLKKVVVPAFWVLISTFLLSSLIVYILGDFAFSFVITIFLSVVVGVVSVLSIGLSKSEYHLIKSKIIQRLKKR